NHQPPIINLPLHYMAANTLYGRSLSGSMSVDAVQPLVSSIDTVFVNQLLANAHLPFEENLGNVLSAVKSAGRTLQFVAAMERMAQQIDSEIETYCHEHYHVCAASAHLCLSAGIGGCGGLLDAAEGRGQGAA